MFSVSLLIALLEYLLLVVLTPHVCFPQQQMSKILTTVTHLNHAKAEATDSERCTIKTETGTGTANAKDEGENNANSSSSRTMKRRVSMPRRSKRVLKGLCDQVMTNQDSSGDKVRSH